MCGRFTLIQVADSAQNMFGLDFGAIEPRYNIAPKQRTVAILYDAKSRGITSRQLWWGLVPSWGEDKSMAARCINARMETIESKPSFRSSFRNRRCLIPASGFYEWKRGAGGKKPYYFFPSALDEGLMFAGIWDEWKGHDEIYHSFAIITIPADSMMRPIHDRMPALLPPEAWEQWLTPTFCSQDARAIILSAKSYPKMHRHKVGARVNKVGNEGAECIVPVTETGRLFSERKHI